MLANWVGTAGYVWGAGQRGRPAAAGGLSSPRPHPRRGARSREEGPARPGRAAGEVHAGTELLSVPRHILRSLLPCNFSSALRSNSKPEPATADGGGCPGSPPWALCGSPTHPAGGGAPGSRGSLPHGAAPEKSACPPLPGDLRRLFPAPLSPAKGRMRAAAPARGRAVSVDRCQPPDPRAAVPVSRAPDLVVESSVGFCFFFFQTQRWKHFNGWQPFSPRLV